MTLIVTYLFFFLLILISFYITGYLALLFLRIKLAHAEKHTVSLIIGMILFVLFSLFFALIGLPHATLIVIEISVLLFLFQKQLFLVKTRKHHEHPHFIKYILQQLHGFAKDVWKKKKNLLHVDYWPVVLILLGAISFSAFHLSSGSPTAKGVEFVGIHATEGIYHLASIKSMVFHFPPIDPGIAGVPQNRVSPYDFLLSRFILFYGLSAEELYFRLFPLYNAVLLGASSYVFFKIFTRKRMRLRLLLISVFVFLNLLTYVSTYGSGRPLLTISAYDYNLYQYFTKAVGTDEFIIYLPTNGLHKQPVIAAMMGRPVYYETPSLTPTVHQERSTKLEELRKALKACHEETIHNVLKDIGSVYILTEEKDPCLISSKVRGIKMSSQTLQFYVIEN